MIMLIVLHDKITFYMEIVYKNETNKMKNQTLIYLYHL